MSRTSRVLRSLLAVGAATVAFAAGAQNTEPKVLNIYNWAEYIAEDTLKNFEKETGIKVRYDIFDSNEILHAKLVAGKTGYDIVVPGAHFAKAQIEGGLFQKLDKSLLPNWKNLDPAVLEQMAKVDPGNQYLVDWLWGYVTVGINVKKVKAALGSTPMPANAWDLLFKPEYASKLKGCGVSMLDSASEVMPVAMIYAGKPPYSKNAKDYDAARDVLAKARPYITRFSSSGYIDEMANGSLCLVMGYAGDMNISRQRAIDSKTGVEIQVLVPPSGATMFFDSMAIPKDAEHPKNAHLFINYILRPEVHAALTNKVFYANPNAASKKFVKKEVASNPTVFLSPEDMKKLTSPDAVPQDIRRVQTRIFTAFKAGAK
ncbi:polyamine ABC transporter substrate-binding protein [Rubrivivax gelatinosus]|uniref:Putrescine-binding periplasmic protein n=1 Tax=Rubrivivax gelatinosus (strain NBRC 100245 / IL144) TaxID=983917 RepID=I0HK40_RUBGI|nr:polyamine ABC transporter substrate-binding protein [Rubrivivax gelatinosus]BAL93377.1 putative ABC transporter substrate binding protein [Rubrivivax gelatinosus IL144]